MSSPQIFRASQDALEVTSLDVVFGLEVERYGQQAFRAQASAALSGAHNL